jgi:hypothetical protein
LDEHQIIEMSAAAVEENDKKRRAKNVLISGVKMPANTEEKDRKLEDETFVKSMFRTLHFEEPKVVRRFKSSNSSETPPLILVTLPDSLDRNKVLFESKKLRNFENFKSVYINPDQTVAERAFAKKLREERNKMNDGLGSNSSFRYFIRGNQLVKLKKQSERVVHERNISQQ